LFVGQSFDDRLSDDEGEENNCFITPLAFRGVIGV